MPTGKEGMISPVAAFGLSDGLFIYPHDFEWTPRLAVSRAGIGQFRLDTPVAMLKPGGRVMQVLVDRLRGNDGNGDGSAAKPFRTISKAWMLALAGYDTVEIIVQAESLPSSRILWGAEGQCVEYPTHVARPMNIILRASDGGRFYIAACGMPHAAEQYNAPPVWTRRSGRVGVDALYSAPIDRQASPLALPYDLSPAALASNNRRPRAPRRAASAIDASARPGSAFIDPTGGLLWFRPFDDRDMAGDIFVTHGSIGPNQGYGLNVSVGTETVAGKIIYLHNLSVIGGSGGIRGTNQSQGRARTTVVLDDVEVFGQAENTIQSTGGYDLYVVSGAYGGAAADALNVHAGGAHNSAVEVMQTRIFAHGVAADTFCGLAGDGRNNDATLHEWCLGAYFDCHFAQSDGRVVGFIDNSRGVVAGCTIGGSAASDASGFRTMVSVSGAAIMDLVECTLLPQLPGPISPSIRADARAWLRLHGTTKAALLNAGLTLGTPAHIVEEDAASTRHPCAGPLRLYNRLVARGGTTRLYVRGVWQDAAWSAILLGVVNYTLAQGQDSLGHYVDVEIGLLAGLSPILRLTHAPLDVQPWTYDITLDAAVAPDFGRSEC